MTEIQFLVELLQNDEMSKELHDKLLYRIGELELQRHPLAIGNPGYPMTVIVPLINAPLVNHSVCQHDYPTPWMGIVPPNCRKCGFQAPHYTVTCLNKAVFG